MSRRAGDLSPFMLVARPLGEGKRNLRDHGGAGPRLASDRELAPEQRDTFTHAREAHPLTGSMRRGHGRRVEPTPVIPDLEADPTPPAHKRDARPDGTCVLACVGECFLHHPVERRLNLGGRTFLPEGLLVADLPALPPVLLDQQPECDRQPEVVECRGPEAFDDQPGFLYRLLT